MPQIGGLVEPGGAPGGGPTFQVKLMASPPPRLARGARRPPAGGRRFGDHRRRAALVRGWTATFFTGAEGGGWSFSMLGLSRDR